MELTFSNLVNISTGSFPDVVQFYDTSAEVFSIIGGEMKGKPIGILDGEYGTPALEDAVPVSNDTNISNFEIKTLNGFGIIGGYRTNTSHKMIIYEFAYELDRFLDSGTIKLSGDKPVTSFTLTLDNPIDEGSDKQLNVAISEKEALLAPGAKVALIFFMGDADEELEMGSYFIDRSDYSVLRETVNVDGRNLIGKALSDQTLDENNALPFDFIHNVLSTMFENANLNSDQFLIETSTTQNSFQFEPNTSVLNALNEILKATINWKVEELFDGTIVVGSPNYSAFTQPGTYTFNRGTDIMTRNIARDDMSVYRRVCVHTSDYSVKVYRDVSAFSGWNLQSNKTLYVSVPDGTLEPQAILYAEELALRLGNVGKIESFTGPFRPQLMPGDQAHIMAPDGTYDLGVITEVTHRFGKKGYYTDFTVDSGGRLGKGKLSDYIAMITQPRSSGSIGYE